MDADKLLEALRDDSMARLRHLVLRRAGVSPFGLRARLISDARVLEEACFMVLEGEKIPPVAEAASPLYKGGEMGETPHPSPAATPSPQGEGFKGSLNGGFDMERFEKMKEAADERI